MTERTANDALNQQEDDNGLLAQARRIVTLQAEIKDREDEITRLKGQIVKAHAPGTYTAGDLSVQVREGSSRIDFARFEAKYPARDHQEWYKLALNTHAIHKDLGEADLEEVQVQGSPSVVVA